MSAQWLFSIEYYRRCRFLIYLGYVIIHQSLCCFYLQLWSSGVFWFLWKSSLYCAQYDWFDWCLVYFWEQANKVYRARMLASKQPHLGTWLNAIPLSSPALLLDDETLRISALRIWVPAWEPHHRSLVMPIQCWSSSLFCKSNDVVKCGLAAVDDPSCRELLALTEEMVGVPTKASKAHLITNCTQEGNCKALPEDSDGRKPYIIFAYLCIASTSSSDLW